MVHPEDRTEAVRFEVGEYCRLTLDKASLTNMAIPASMAGRECEVLELERDGVAPRYIHVLSTGDRWCVNPIHIVKRHKPN